MLTDVSYVLPIQNRTCIAVESHMGQLCTVGTPQSCTVQICSGGDI